ncbi:hypothetical protein CMO83_05435 [Candidatus Woesearchaeota archaeon]|jgi:hypothetical protein|nr:hypothetical protein [Candidatus Woesearchaeota archaeon]MAG92091.1 hypothetical protein [Candidatus Woesearchaeota archaeon]|tara:strand:- start:2565 stop:2900 length:336 start_codon:yes stop_codon:yes gene_type:complete
MVLGIQIAGFLFGMFMIYYSFVNYKKKQFNAKEFGFWFVLWMGFLVVTIYPAILDPLTKSLSFFRTLDLLVISGMLFLIAINFYTYVVTRKNQKQLEKIVRSIAIKKGRNK